MNNDSDIELNYAQLLSLQSEMAKLLWDYNGRLDSIWNHLNDLNDEKRVEEQKVILDDRDGSCSKLMLFSFSIESMAQKIRSFLTTCQEVEEYHKYYKNNKQN